MKRTLFSLIVYSASALLSLAHEEVRAQQNHVLTTATTPSITSQQSAELRRVLNDQMGVAGKDPIGHKIGPNVAKRSGLGLNWYPVDIYKQTLCGTLHDFAFYDGWGDEADWNNFIVPGPRHVFLLEDVKPIADPDQLHDCGGLGNCVEAEITPDQHFYENPWFTKSTQESVVEGKKLCTYGPWVWEEAHGNRPEIHPSELYWWTETVSSNETNYFLIVLQDDSNRFDRKEDYNGSITRPWSQVPRTGEFRIAFQLNPNLERVRFRIDELAKRNVVTKGDLNARRDADDGKSHAIQFNGRIVVQVDELQPNDEDIGIRFVEVTRGNVGPLPSLQGYIAITTKIGNNDRGEEGYHVLRVRSKASFIQQPVDPTPAVTPVPTPAPIAALKPAVLAKPLRNSFRFAVVEGQPRLTSDVQLQTLSGEVLETVKDVPALRGGAGGFQTASGSVLRLSLPEVALAPIISPTRSLLLQDAQAAWPNFVQAAGGSDTSDAPPADLKLSKEVRIDAAPFYAPVRRGKPAREDDSPFSEELNEIVKAGSTERRMQVFGSSQPIKDLTWSFAARNLTSGEVVSVRVGEPSDQVIAIEFLLSDPPKASIRVIFPSGPITSIYELVATAEMTDVFGTKGITKRTIWSHSLANVDRKKLVDAVLPVAAHMAGMKADKLLVASKLDNLPQDDRTVSDPLSRCARMSRLYATSAAEDGVITVGELARLKEAVALCKTR